MRLERLILALAFAATSYTCLERPDRIRDCARSPDLTFPGGARAPADILFVLDDAGLAVNEQAKLAAALPSFVAAIRGVDVHIGVVTGDLVNPFARGGSIQVAYNALPPFNLVEYSYAMCTDVGIAKACLHGFDADGRFVRSSEMTIEAEIAALSATVRVGSCGSGHQEPLEVTIEALKKASPGACNDGFLREDANLVLIYMSNNDDRGMAPVEETVEALLTLKDLARVRVGAIVGAESGEPAYCGSLTGTTCGSLCDERPEEGSHVSCTPGNPSECPAGEFCQSAAFEASVTHRCERDELRNWNTFSCGDCSFFDAPDCCLGEPATRTIDFAHAIARRVSEMNPAFTSTRCVEQGALRSACVVRSICDASFEDSLRALAERLVIDPVGSGSTFSIDPPVSDPGGALVAVNGVPVQPGADYRITPDGRTLVFTSPRAASDRIDVFCAGP